jgi:hypothetical protein
VLHSVQERGHQPGYVAMDREYLPRSRPEALQLPLRDMGYDPVFEYGRDQLGVVASDRDMIMVEGQWHVPSMPQELINASADHRSGAIDDDTYEARIAARRQFQLKPKGAPGKNGQQRFIVPDPTAPTPRAAKTVTISREAGAKYVQSLRYGSDLWRRVYGVLHGAAEYAAGDLELSDMEQRPGHGVAAQSLYVAFVAFVQNVRRLRRFMAQVPGDDVDSASKKGAAS